MSEKKNHSVHITRLFDAPRELVFKAWVDPKYFAKWWGPHMFTNPVCELDVRPGGNIHVHMIGLDGVVHPMGGTFHEVVEPERLVFTTTAFEDGEGNHLLEVHNTVTFVDKEGKTELTLYAEVVRATPELDPALAGMGIGWMQSQERLTDMLIAEVNGIQAGGAFFTCPPDEPIVIITHVFDAPRDLVWKVSTEPEYLAKWWGPRSLINHVREMDFRAGGKWRIEQHAPDGSVFTFKGEYYEVEAPERFINTFGMEGMYEDKRVIQTQTFHEFDGKTRVTVVIRLETIADRDGMVASGMESGVVESYERCVELLQTI